MGVALYFIVASFSVIFLYYYLWARKLYGFWERKGVKHPKPRYILGNTTPQNIAPSELYLDLYQKYQNEKYIGLYEFSSARLMIMDPTLIQNVLIKDFSHFTDRGSSFIPGNPRKNNDGGIFFMSGPKWRAVRNKLSPTFTSGKLKVMFDRMVECCNNMDELIESKGGEMEARELMFSYTIDIIASCAFGLDIHKDKETAEKFRKMGLKALAMSLPKLLFVILLTNFPMLSKLIKVPFLNKDTLVYFGKILTDALKFRRETGYTRNDFLQLLIQLKDKGNVEHHAIEPEDEYLNITKTPTAEKYEFTESMVMGQAFTFITAGMEPSGNTLTFVLCELAWRQDIQDKVRKEIEEVLQKNDNQFTYNALRDMEYLENCILETLRLYPVAKQVRRVCTKKYRLDDSVTLDVDTSIVVPAKAMHLDPKYFPDPFVFNPDRFKNSNHLPCTFFPFGEGPRICIGMRFAMVEMKVVLCKLIQNYRLSPGKYFTYPIPLNRWSFFTLPSKPVNIKLQKINKAD